MRKMQSGDAPKLARLIHAIWPDDNPDPARIARVSLDSSKLTLIEEVDNQIIGFVSAFPTISVEGTRRWEVDLLGVHPSYHGRGIGTRLVQAAVEDGRSRSAKMARALIGLDNTASLHTFQHCGFVLDETVLDIYAVNGEGRAMTTFPSGVYLIPIATLTYEGMWIEGNLSLDGLHYSRESGKGNIGVLIPTGTLPAEQAGFEHHGHYRWVELTF